jgi:hypothetical protein
LRATLSWNVKKVGQKTVEVELAQALKERDAIVFDFEGTRYMGEVDQVLHAPVLVGSDLQPTVMYAVTISPAETYMRSWVVRRSQLRAMFPKIF